MIPNYWQGINKGLRGDMKNEKSQAAVKESEKAAPAAPVDKPVEIGGPKGLEPTRYGDWQQKGRVSDF
jgi:hypothetical protein